MRSPAVFAAAFLLALGGCIGAQDEPAEGATDQPTVAGPMPDAASSSTLLACPSGPDNHGTYVAMGDRYLAVGRSGNIVVVYEEANHCPGLQTEEEFAQPDRKLAASGPHAAA
ncbi:MAG TPA: hypothetical protein VFH47_00385 [Candidatus Thermoplasmatota archaeon]|nr:hypothetical protein [Candidatus Thermoplasmatota archaeon]